MTQATLQRCPREPHLDRVLFRICVDRDHADAQDLGAVGEARWGRGVRFVCKDTTAPDGSLQVQREECCRLKHHDDRSSARLSYRMLCVALSVRCRMSARKILARGFIPDEAVGAGGGYYYA